MVDCLIIGAGISGTSLALECSKYKGSILVLEKENDVSQQTTKANSAIIHAGYDPKPKTLMAKYNVEGNRLTQKWCKDLDVRIKNIGSLVVAFNDQEKETLKQLMHRGIENGVANQRIVEKEELFQMEPNLNERAVAALYAPSACIVDPWDMAIACAETSVRNGVSYQFNQEVIGIEKKEDVFVVQTKTDCFEAKVVVNAAGVHCDQIVKMLRQPDYEIVPNKGEYYLLDKSQGNLVNHVIFQCPNENGKGVLVSPTVHGNLIVGPSATPVENNEDVSTTSKGLSFVKERALLSVPSIQFGENIRTFAGLRARRKDGADFIIGQDPEIENFYQIAGMASPGLSSAIAIAVDVRKQFESKGLFCEKKEDAITTRQIIRFKEADHKQRAQLIEKNPAYGRIICRCETITEGEILDALHRPIVPVSIDGIKRRCNAGMGRCQGGFCGPRVQEIIAKELGIQQEQVLQDKKGSVVLFGQTKQGGCHE